MAHESGWCTYTCLFLGPEFVGGYRRNRLKMNSDVLPWSKWVPIELIINATSGCNIPWTPSNNQMIFSSFSLYLLSGSEQTRYQTISTFSLSTSMIKHCINIYIYMYIYVSLILSYLFLSHLILSCLVFSYLISYLILSCLIISYQQISMSKASNGSYRVQEKIVIGFNGNCRRTQHYHWIQEKIPYDWSQVKVVLIVMGLQFHWFHPMVTCDSYSSTIVKPPRPIQHLIAIYSFNQTQRVYERVDGG